MKHDIKCNLLKKNNIKTIPVPRGPLSLTNKNMSRCANDNCCVPFSLLTAIGHVRTIVNGLCNNCHSYLHRKHVPRPRVMCMRTTAAHIAQFAALVGEKTPGYDMVKRMVRLPRKRVGLVDSHPSASASQADDAENEAECEERRTSNLHSAALFKSRKFRKSSRPMRSPLF